MRILVDTHVALWALADKQKLSNKSREILEDGHNQILVSAVSMWEIAIKLTLKRIEVDLTLLEQAIADVRFEPLAITFRHAIEVSSLPLHHRDPFDRMLIAQCLVEGVQFLTHDAPLCQYGKFVILG